MQADPSRTIRRSIRAPAPGLAPGLATGLARPAVLLAGMMVAGVLLAGCQSRPAAAPWPDRPVPPPAARAAPPVIDPGPAARPAATIAVPAGPGTADPSPPLPGVRSYTTGCNGHFTVVDARGRTVRSGRAHNTGSGLVLLDARGGRGAAVPQAATGQTLLFLPDCGCQARADRGPAGPVAVADATTVTTTTATPARCSAD